jgi:hypothetical protein
VPVPAVAQGTAPFTATGDVEIVPGATPDPAQTIRLSPASTQAKVNLPVEIARYVVAVNAVDPRGVRTACPVNSTGQMFMCTAPAGTAFGSIVVAYHVPPDLSVDLHYPLTVPVTVTDLGTGIAATVHVTIRPHADMVLRGPYVANVPPTDGGIVVTVANQGPSESSGSRLAITITGTFRVISVLPATTCTGAGGQITCHFVGLGVGDQVSASIALGTDSGAVQVTARVTGDDVDPVSVNDSASGGPWAVFAPPGTPGAWPPLPVGRGVPAPVPPPRTAASSPVLSTTPSASPADPRSARAVATNRHWPMSHYVALALLGGSALYLVLGGAALLRKRFRRRPVVYGDLEIDLDR